MHGLTGWIKLSVFRMVKYSFKKGWNQVKRKCGFKLWGELLQATRGQKSNTHNRLMPKQVTMHGELHVRFIVKSIGTPFRITESVFSDIFHCYWFIKSSTHACGQHLQTFLKERVSNSNMLLWCFVHSGLLSQQILIRLRIFAGI